MIGNANLNKDGIAMMPTKKQRIEWVDAAKGIGLILVVFGHLFTYGGAVSSFIFSFHMPLFFILSGFLFKPEKLTTVWNVIVKAARQLLKPYVVFCVLGLIVSFAIPAWRSGLDLGTLKQVFILCAPEDLHVGQIWFLVSLFWVELFAGILALRLRGVF